MAETDALCESNGKAGALKGTNPMKPRTIQVQAVLSVVVSALRSFAQIAPLVVIDAHNAVDTSLAGPALDAYAAKQRIDSGKQIRPLSTRP